MQSCGGAHELDITLFIYLCFFHRIINVGEGPPRSLGPTFDQTLLCQLNHSKSVTSSCFLNTYRDGEMSCREKIRKAEVQLELNLATVVKDDKNCFHKYTARKRGTRKTPILYGIWRGTLSPQMRKKLPSLAQSLTVRLIILRATISLSWQSGKERRGPPHYRKEWSVICCAT